MTNQSFLWVEKYRPKKITDCILPESIKNTFLEFVGQKEIPNLLLSGGSGVGKTTVARAVCEELHADYILINGEKDNKVVEYQDSLHEHFKYPCNIQNGNYMPPLDHGYSIEMKEESVKRYLFPKGEYWSKLN